MERKIKFRAWDTLSKNMIENALELKNQEHNNFGNILKDKTKIVMQYTGLKDKNGVEIYEGDIVEEEFLQSWIGWCDKCAGWQPKYFYEKQLCHKCSGDYGIDEIETFNVIGNLYENSELIEK